MSLRHASCHLTCNQVSLATMSLVSLQETIANHVTTFSSGVSGIQEAVSSHSQSLADASLNHLSAVKEMSESQVNDFENSKVSLDYRNNIILVFVCYACLSELGRSFVTCPTCTAVLHDLLVPHPLYSHSFPSPGCPRNFV